jgi:hypothetical protein
MNSMLNRIVRRALQGLSVATFAIATLAVAPAAAQSIGAIAAVNQSATGRPPGASMRALTIGLPIVAREQIQTNEVGTAQIVFTDQSTMNVGRGSTIVVDRYVYDPTARAGQQAVSLTRGMLRFVGGQVSHGAGMSVRTPVATVGVRGGIGTVGFVPGCGMLVLNQYGSVAVANGVGSTTIRRPGYHVCVTSQNAAIGEPRPIPPELLARAMALLTSAPGQTGGTLQPLNENVARNLGFGATRLPDRPGPPQGTPGLDTLAGPRGGNAVVKSGAQGANGGDPASGCTSIFCN